MTINYKELRQLRRSWDNEPDNTQKMGLNPFIMAILAIIMLLAMSGVVFAKNAPIKDVDAVRAILGEAENESMIGKIAIGEVIRTRGGFKGIYGYNAVKYVNGRYYRGKRAISPTIAVQALKAWKLSANTNYALNAQGWGNASDLKVFARQSWWRNCAIVAKIGDHYFWKVKKGA